MKTSPLLLLHGAIGSAEQMQSLASMLGADYEVYTINFNGHGGYNVYDEDFSIDYFATQVLGWLNMQRISTIDIFGYSMGGYVAAYLARHFEGRVGRIMTLATKWQWDEPTAAREVKLLDADKIAAKLPAFAQQLAVRHGEANWRGVLAKTAKMLGEMGACPPLPFADLSAIQVPVRLMVGDRDTMVGIEETAAAYRQFPNGSLQVLPQTAHPIERVNGAILAAAAAAFLTKD